MFLSATIIYIYSIIRQKRKPIHNQNNIARLITINGSKRTNLSLFLPTQVPSSWQIAFLSVSSIDLPLIVIHCTNKGITKGTSSSTDLAT